MSWYPFLAELPGRHSCVVDGLGVIPEKVLAPLPTLYVSNPNSIRKT
jgi:hypothetical protein